MTSTDTLDVAVRPKPRPSHPIRSSLAAMLLSLWAFACEPPLESDLQPTKSNESITSNSKVEFLGPTEISEEEKIRCIDYTDKREDPEALIRSSVHHEVMGRILENRINYVFEKPKDLHQHFRSIVIVLARCVFARLEAYGFGNFEPSNVMLDANDMYNVDPICDAPRSIACRIEEGGIGGSSYYIKVHNKCFSIKKKQQFSTKKFPHGALHLKEDVLKKFREVLTHVKEHPSHSVDE